MFMTAALDILREMLSHDEVKATIGCLLVIIVYFWLSWRDISRAARAQGLEKKKRRV